MLPIVAYFAVFLLFPVFSVLIGSVKSRSEAFPVNFRLAVSKNPTLKYPRRQRKEEATVSLALANKISLLAAVWMTF